MTPAILVGTRKGLFVLKGDEARREWELEEPHLSGWDVFHAVKDDGSLFAAAQPRRLRRDRPALERRRQDLGAQREASGCPRITS